MFHTSNDSKKIERNKMTKRNDLAKFGGTPILDKGFIYPSWPVMDKSYEKVVIDQLHESISIYNRSGIFARFEDKFSNIHNKKYAVLNNSGTNSIWAMFVGAGLMPGDEVLCPTYTFFATNTPLLSSGLRPVFCDSNSDGNIDPDDIVRKITNKTKAILITHMWGYPCDMDRITTIAKEHGLLLFEDCSHAHLAKWGNNYVGSFGDAAAWSLQGQKNITGGEGGITITDNATIYERATLLGHYNKRCKDEIPDESKLKEFAVTGMGLKMRAHPIAIAIADHILDRHEEYQSFRNYCAKQYEVLLSSYHFIELQNTKNMSPSWYAFVFKIRPESGINREQLVDLLHAEGLKEVDIPGSTGPNHLLPIFNKPAELFPQFYEAKESFNTVEGDFHNAEKFYKSVVKLPTWTLPEHQTLIDAYIKGLKKVLDYVATD